MFQEHRMWYCVQTRPNMEFLSVAHMRRRRFTVFLPTYEIEQKRLGVVIGKRTRPLFPSHCFVSMDLAIDPWRDIWSMVGVKKLYSSSPYKPIPLPPDTVESLIYAQDHASDEAEIIVHITPVKIPESPSMKAGDTARIIDGPLRDLKGVCKWTKKDRVMLCLQIMSGEVNVEFSLSNLELSHAPDL